METIETTCKKCGHEIGPDDAHGLCLFCADDEANACAVHDGQIGRAAYERMHKNAERAAGRELPRNL